MSKAIAKPAETVRFEPLFELKRQAPACPLACRFWPHHGGKSAFWPSCRLSSKPLRRTASRKHQISVGTLIAVLAEVDSLPGAQYQISIPDWDREAATEHRSFDMCGHVVGTFARMLVRKVLRSQRRKRTLQVFRYVWIRIFVDRERR